MKLLIAIRIELFVFTAPKVYNSGKGCCPLIPKHQALGSALVGARKYEYSRDFRCTTKVTCPLLCIPARHPSCGD